MLCASEGEARDDVALWFDSQRPFVRGCALLVLGCFGDLFLAMCWWRPSSCCDFARSCTTDEVDSYGLKLDLGVSLDDPLDSVPGDSLSRLPFVLFSMLASSFGLGESDPMALHVCANSASGLVLESNCKQKEKEKGKVLIIKLTKQLFAQN